jgi:hypothetical protein
VGITDEEARVVAERIQKGDLGVERVVRFHTEHDHVLALLIVNTATIETGITPIHFAAEPPEFPHHLNIVEVSEREYQKVLSGELRLPDGWRQGSSLIPWAPLEVKSRFERLLRD